jgi:hypothetical protein
MTNRHVLNQLPFWIAGDLDAPETEAVQAHLDQCPDCRAAAEALRTSQAWLREALASPFDAADYAALRESVMAHVRLEPSPRRIARLTPRTAVLAAGAATLLMAILIPLWHRTPGAPPSVASTASAPAARPLPPPSFHPGPNPPTLPRLARPQPLRMARAEPTPGPARIEFQISDPAIRIIWLAQATPSPDPNPSIPEAP